MSKSLKSFLAKKFPDASNTKILEEIMWVNTGDPALNYVLSGLPASGGIPLSGKITILYGPEGAGKTSIIADWIAKTQEAHIEVVFIDTERSMTKKRLHQFNVNIDDLIYLTPDSMEECFDIIEKIYDDRIDSGSEEPVLIIWDSIASAPTVKQLERTSEQVEIAAEAGVITRNIKRIRGKIQKINAGLIIINQARANQAMFGDLFTMPGGHALQHNADVILRVNRTKPDVNGQIIKVSTPSKNRLFRPFQSIEMRLEYENGFTKENKINNFLQFLKKIEVICSAGAYNYFRADVDEIMEKEGLSEKEATKKAKKFHLKAVVEQMVNDEDYYKKMIDKAEQLVNTSLLKVLKVMQDPEFKEEIDKEEALEVAIENEFNTSKSIEE